MAGKAVLSENGLVWRSSGPVALRGASGRQRRQCCIGPFGHWRRYMGVLTTHSMGDSNGNAAALGCVDDTVPGVCLRPLELNPRAAQLVAGPRQRRQCYRHAVPTPGGGVVRRPGQFRLLDSYMGVSVVGCHWHPHITINRCLGQCELIQSVPDIHFGPGYF